MATGAVVPAALRATAGRARRWAVEQHVLVVGLLLVAAQATLRMVVGSGSYFWQDDFLHLDLAQTLGLSATTSSATTAAISRSGPTP